MPRLPFHGRPTPPSQLTDDEVIHRWRVLTPNFFRYLCLFFSTSVGLFFINRWVHPSQKMTDYMNVAFQMSCAFTAYYIFLYGMARYYGRKWRPQTQNVKS